MRVRTRDFNNRQPLFKTQTQAERTSLIHKPIGGLKMDLGYIVKKTAKKELFK